MAACLDDSSLDQSQRSELTLGSISLHTIPLSLSPLLPERPKGGRQRRILLHGRPLGCYRRHRRDLLGDGVAVGGGAVEGDAADAGAALGGYGGALGGGADVAGCGQERGCERAEAVGCAARGGLRGCQLYV